MSGVRYGVLGPLEVRDDEVVAAVGPPQRRAVLGVLLSSANRFVSQDRLIDAVWNGRAGADRLGSVQAHVSRLRGVLGRSAIDYRAQGYLLRTGPDDVDADRFERAAAEGRRLCAAGEPASGREVLADTLALWRGEAFEDFRYDDWAQPHIRRLTELRWDTVQARLDAELRLGRHDSVVPELEALVDSRPDRDRLCALLMLALYRCGRQGDALAAYRGWRDRLHDTAGLSPPPRLRALEQQILRHDPALVLPVRKRPGSARRRTNLPAPLTSFVGRAAELAALAGLLATRRLVTVVGPGGAGKTRLALRLATDGAEAWPDGVWWVDVAATDGLDGVVAAVRDALELSTGRGQVAPLGRLIDALVDRKLLLLLDCCEPVTAAVAEFVGHLLDGCPGVTALCTSREPLAVLGEVVWPIPLLEVTGSGDALRLFLDRAAGVDPGLRLEDGDLAASAEICRRMDGLPLGIEIAAAQLRDLSPTELLARLTGHAEELTAQYRNVPARHRSLADTIAWSYELLDAPQRRLFARLAVLEPPIRAADVAATGLAGDGDAGALLRELADKSLLVRTRHRGSTHYRMLDAVRAYAGSVLDRSGERAAVTEATARHFAGFAAAGGHVAPSDEVGWVDRARVGEANIAAALRWCADHDPAMGVRAFVGMLVYLVYVVVTPGAWVPLGRALAASDGLDEQERLRLRAAIALTGADVLAPDWVRGESQAVLDHPLACSGARITALRTLTRLADNGFVDADACNARTIEIGQAIDHPDGARLAAISRYLLTYRAGDLPAARRHLEAAWAVTGVSWTVITRPFYHRNLADLLHQLGEVDEALMHARAALAAAEAVGSAGQRAMSLAALAEIMVRTAPAEQALVFALEAATAAYDIDSTLDQLEALVAVAHCCARSGRFAVAARVYGAALGVLARRGAVPLGYHIGAGQLEELFRAAGLRLPTAPVDATIPEVLAEAATPTV